MADLKWARNTTEIANVLVPAKILSPQPFNFCVLINLKPPHPSH
jgi:hypothetical protein